MPAIARETWRLVLATPLQLVSLIVALSAPVLAQGLPIVVGNPSDVARVDEMVITSLAIPQWLPVAHPKTVLRLVDDAGQPVASQAKVLTRWNAPREDPDAPTRFCLIIFRATVPAGSSRTYYIQIGPEHQAGLSIVDGANEVVVDTGAATFTISKSQLSLLDAVEIGGDVVAGPGRLELVRTDGSLASAVLHSTLIEEKGHLRCIVRQKGTIPSLGLDFTLRTTLIHGSRDARMDFRLENNGNYGEIYNLGTEPEHAWFQSLALVVPSTGTPIQYMGNAGGITPIGTSLKVEQDFGTPTVSYDMQSGFTWQAELGSAVVATGQTYPGAIGVRCTGGSSAVAVDRFWQNFPKGFTCSANEVSADLWPAFGNGPLYGGPWSSPSSPNLDPIAEDHYRFEGGRWKTHTLLWRFGAAGQPLPKSEIDLLAKRVNQPLLGRIDPEWTCRTLALGDAVVAARNWSDVGAQRFERLIGVLGRDELSDPPTQGLPPIGLPKFIKRGGTWGGQQMYGWTNWGDVAWDDGYCSLHYDLPYSTLLEWYRTGHYDFFDAGRDMAAHRRDYDQVHTKSLASNRRGGQSYEKGYYHGNYSAPATSHTWVGGLLIYYAITGDEGAREAAIEVGDFIQRMQPENWDGNWGARIPGWSLVNMLNLWVYLGEQQYVSCASAIVDNWNLVEASQGQQGHVINYGNVQQPQAQSWMHAIVLGGLCRYFAVTQDADALVTVERMADWMMNDVIESAPSGPAHARTIGRVWESIGLNGWTNNLHTHHVWSITHALSWAAWVANEPSYLAMAGDLWNGVTRYQQRGASQLGPYDWNDPSSYSAISYRQLAFPGSESKVMSNIALWGGTYLAFREVFAGTW